MFSTIKTSVAFLFLVVFCRIFLIYVFLSSQKEEKYLDHHFIASNIYEFWSLAQKTMKHLNPDLLFVLKSSKKTKLHPIIYPMCLCVRAAGARSLGELLNYERKIKQIEVLSRPRAGPGDACPEKCIVGYIKYISCSRDKDPRGERVNQTQKTHAGFTTAAVRNTPSVL